MKILRSLAHLFNHEWGQWELFARGFRRYCRDCPRYQQD